MIETNAISSTLFAAAIGLLASLPVSAQAAADAQGSFTVNGKVYALRHAAAFVDAADARKPTVLVLSDRPLPAKALVSSASLSLERNLNAFSGIALWLDAQRQIFRAE